MPTATTLSTSSSCTAYAEGRPVVLFGELDAGSNGVLAHDPGAKTPLALGCARVTSPRLAANFVILNPEGANTGSLIEDGVAILLDAPTWKRLQSDLAAHKPITIPLADGLSLAVEWPAARNEAPAASYCLR